MAIKFSKFKILSVSVIEVISWILLVPKWKKRAGRSKISENPHKKIVILEPYGLGDCVFLFNMIETIKNYNAGTEIYIICSPYWSSLFEGIDNVFTKTFEFPWVREKRNLIRYPFHELWEFVRRVREIGVDIGFDVRGDIRSQILLNLFKCKQKVGFINYVNSNINLRGLLMTDVVHCKIEHKILQNNKLLEAIGIKANNHTMTIVNDRVNGLKNEYYLTFNFGAGWKYKQWRPGKWAELINSIIAQQKGNYQIVYHPTERYIVENIKPLIKANLNITYTCTDTIKELIMAISKSDSFIGLDSGPIHVAAALGKKVVGLYGPGQVDIFYPFCEKRVVIHHQDQFPCAPCMQRECVSPENNCMESIEVGEVLEAFQKL
jgi:ADP-heptose:LPS heptosyltransferase